MTPMSASAATHRTEMRKERRRGEGFSGGGNEAALTDTVAACESSRDAGGLRRSDRSVFEASTGKAAVEHAKKSRARLRLSASAACGKPRSLWVVGQFEIP